MIWTMMWDGIICRDLLEVSKYSIVALIAANNDI